MGRCGLLFLFVCSLGARDLRGQTGWNPLPPILGSIGFDGNLQQEFDLGSLTAESGAVDLSLTLEHIRQRTYGGEDRSLWTVPQLVSFFVRESADRYLWKAPGNLRRDFDGQGLCLVGNFDYPGTWTARFLANDTVEVTCGAVICYRYHGGALTGFDTGDRSFAVEANGPLISGIWDQTSTARIKVLTAEFDNLGRPTRLVVNGRRHFFFYPPDDMRMLRWEEDRDKVRNTVVFKYERGMVTEARGADFCYNYRWSRITKCMDPRIENYWSDTNLAADNDSTYDYEINTSGIMISRERLADRRCAKVLFNPLRRTLREVDYDGHVQVSQWSP